MLLHLIILHSILAPRSSPMFEKTDNRRQQSNTLRITAWVLLVFYIAGTSSLQIARAFVHSHEHTVVHSAEAEKDPCHRFIYHNDVAQSCDHDSHLVASDTCDMCDLAYHGDQALLNIMNFQIVRLKPEFFSHYKVNLDSYWAVISSSRAPPALI